LHYQHVHKFLGYQKHLWIQYFVLLSVFKIGYQPNITEMAASEMTDSAGITAATAFEPELSRKLVKPGINKNKDTSPPCKENIQESRQGGLAVDVNVEWCPSAADTWVQCEDCRKWHMLSDESDPANLPDKWYGNSDCK